MSVRRATSDDLPALEELWRAFAREVPAPAHVDVDEERELAEVAELVAAGTGFVAVGVIPPLGVAACSRSGSSSSAVCQRSAGFFARHFMMT